MALDIQLVREKRGFKKVIVGSASVRPEFEGFKGLLENGVELGGREVLPPRIDVEIKAEKGLFSTSYTVIANFFGTMPLAGSGRLSGFAEVTPRAVRLFTPGGEIAGTSARSRLPLESVSPSAIGDEYSLGIIGNLTAVMKAISAVPIFRGPALNVLKAVAAEAGDIGQVKSN